MNNFIYGTHPKLIEDVKICTYAICKNEIVHVHPWLDSIWADGKGSDYIVVLDTGSTDGTYEELIKYGEELGIPKTHLIIKQHKYETFRFDVARNDSLKLIPNSADIDVCFCVDLDEYIEDTTFWKDVREVVFNHPNFNRIYYKYAQHINKDGSPASVIWYDKLHGVKNWHWEKPVHELLVTSDSVYEESYYLPENKIYLYHHQLPKINRNNYIELLKLRIQESPNDIYAQSYLASHLCELGKYTESIVYYESAILTVKTLQLSDNYFVIPTSYCGLGNCYYRLGLIDDASHYYQMAIDILPTYGEPYINMAQMLIYQGNIERSTEILTLFKSNAVKSTNWYERPYVWQDWKYMQILGDILCWKQDVKASMEVFNNALQCITRDGEQSNANAQGFYSDYEFVLRRFSNEFS